VTAGRAVVLRGDARRLPLPDGIADLILCSPPYYKLREYTDDDGAFPGQIGAEPTPAAYLETLWACMAEWARVLKPAGSIFVNLGDTYNSGPSGRRGSSAGRGSESAGMPAKCLRGLPWRYAIGCTDQLGLILRAEIIWDKPTALPESATDRVWRSHEQVFHFTRQPRYYAAADEIREQYSPLTHHQGYKGAVPYGAGKHGTGASTLHVNGGTNPLGKMPGSVWTIPSAPLIIPERLGVDHFAAYPPELCRRIILGWSPPGICAECGEGRWPVADRSEKVLHRPSGAERIGTHMSAMSHSERERTNCGNVRTVHRITGYACACAPYTDHPGTGERYFTENPGGGSRGRNVSSVRIPHVARGDDGPVPEVGPWREYHLDRWTPPPTRPAVVVDPFAGTGTTMLTAAVLGRIGIGIDRSGGYCRAARWRTRDPGERARVIGAPKPPPAADGQGELFDPLEAL
jgi:DNA modification methylase